MVSVAGSQGASPNFSKRTRCPTQYFAETAPISLLTGQPAVASSEPQVYAILRTISEETVDSSVHVIKALLIHAALCGIQTRGQFRKTTQKAGMNTRTSSES